ncbi:MAG: glycosyltransferase family 4 protein [Planctomycetes bacterium]|nr:glycosyltransferase family 4 protein [Planctomycetota bacterium]
MRIGIYVDVAKDARPSGIGLHVVNLLQALARIDDSNEYLLYYQRGLFEGAGSFPHWPVQPNFRVRPVRLPNRWHLQRPTLWWNWRLPRVLRRDGVDVFHGPNHFLPDFDRRKNIVTIHDLAYFHMRVHGDAMDEVLRVWTKNAFERAAAVIALSENTRRDVEALGVSPERVRVIYGGGHIVPEGQIPYNRVAELKRNRNLPEKYILFVGTLQPRKNVPFLIRSYARLKKETGIPHALVLAGHRDTAAAEIDALSHELGVSQDVIITGYVDAWELPLLYKLADLFVLPTLYEGFTLVTLEAMAYGVPVIATDTSSIREGVADAGLLVPVNDVDGLTQAMNQALTDDSLRKSLIERGRVQAQKFTWEQCARDTLALYREVYEESKRSEPVAAAS